MITLEINKHKYQSYHIQQPHRFPITAITPNIPFAERHKMDKLQYAQYISNLPFKKGDLVTGTWALNCQQDVKAYQVHYVSEIEEIHHMIVDWGNEHMGPHCITLLGLDGSPAGFKGGGNLYVPCPENRLPPEWKEWLVNKRAKLLLDDDQEYCYDC